MWRTLPSARWNNPDPVPDRIQRAIGQESRLDPENDDTGGLPNGSEKRMGWGRRPAGWIEKRFDLPVFQTRVMEFDFLWLRHFLPYCTGAAQAFDAIEYISRNIDLER